MNRKWFSMFSIKIIASFTMVLDHIGCIFFNQYEYPVPNGVLRAIGRIAFILYAFCLAEGFEHTKVAFGDHKRMGVPDSGNRIKAEYKSV